MDDPQFARIAFFVGMAFVLTFQFFLNFFAYRKQIKISKAIINEAVPEALKDRAEVTFWQTVSSGLFVILGYRGLLDIGVSPAITLILFAIALTVMTIPSARWLWRYYRGAFDDTRAVGPPA